MPLSFKTFEQNGGFRSRWQRLSRQRQIMLLAVLAVFGGFAARNYYGLFADYLRNSQREAESVRLSEQRRRDDYEYHRYLDAIDRQTRNLSVVTRAEISLLDRRGTIEFPLPIFDDVPSRASLRVKLEGSDAEHLANLWRSRYYDVAVPSSAMPPMHGIQFYDGERPVLTTAISWQSDSVWLTPLGMHPISIRVNDDGEQLWKWFEARLPLSPHDHATVLIERARESVRDRALERASVGLDVAEQIDPGRPDVAILRARMLLMQHRFTDAIAAYTKAIELRPEYFQLYFDRGVAYSTEQRYQEAIEDFTEAIRLQDFGRSQFLQEATLEDIYHRRGLARLLSGNAGAAIEDFDQAIHDVHGPDGFCPPRYYLSRAEAFRKLGMTSRAGRDEWTAKSLLLTQDSTSFDFETILPSSIPTDDVRK
jgi:tetratricopeptide (TPR) repeat protein